MAWLSTLNPVPGFPEYSGPYTVGSFDVEIPVSELESPNHRDGSAPISYVRATDTAEANIVDYQNVPHKPSKEVFDARDSQLKIRLWELGLIHDAALKMDAGVDMKNLDPNKSRDAKKDSSKLLSMFKGKLDVNRPGSISWAGHSFGAATVHQLVKSTFYRPDSRVEGYTPLFSPAPSSSIVQQITSSTPLILLDIWCLPLTSPNTKWLADKPLPCYAPEGPGGTTLLAILSEAFVKWTDHFQETKRRLSEDPSSDAPKQTKPAPHFFYPLGSAHLSQSDFGILFRWVVKKVLKTDEPERYMKLNVRAILQMLRENGFEVAGTSRIDMEEAEASGEKEAQVAATDSTGDTKILATNGEIRGWVALSTSLDKPSNGAPYEADAKGEPLTQVTKDEGVEL
ncbi:hypothetical protein SLS58_009669 [Diplodia intermedia]|uniref:1-alkyl-2-acetylglycerophosphocholine esterase n=1 Tax=Diplodia intermedia TaxID=856260 RepID=A0ABR3TBB0_9PEZI